MKTLYLNCGMGAAGDMLSSALLELVPDREAILDRLNSLGLPGVHYSAEVSEKCGIKGTHLSVSVYGHKESDVLHEHNSHHSHEHHGSRHNGIKEIKHLINEHLDLPENIRSDMLSVFDLIAEAESRVHGVPVTDIHFHEVGTIDAVADIAAACLLMNELSPDEVVSSPIHVGSGQVRCAHGILPVPAPATAEILKGIPIYGGSIDGELCTPTGAALLKHFVSRFGDMPTMKTEKIGYGMGKKDFPAANCVRATFGETQDRTESVIELSCNVDDMTAEAIGFASDKLLSDGALDVFTVPIGMKKSRPGTMICVLCRTEDKEKIIRALFKHTSTIGIRESVFHRYTLSRKTKIIETPFGTVRKKLSSGCGSIKEKYEYEDLARIADEREISFDDARSMIEGFERAHGGKE